MDLRSIIKISKVYWKENICYSGGKWENKNEKKTKKQKRQHVQYAVDNNWLLNSTLTLFKKECSRLVVAVKNE